MVLAHMRFSAWHGPASAEVCPSEDGAGEQVAGILLWRRTSLILGDNRSYEGPAGRLPKHGEQSASDN